MAVANVAIRLQRWTYHVPVVSMAATKEVQITDRIHIEDGKADGLIHESPGLCSVTGEAGTLCGQ